MTCQVLILDFGSQYTQLIARIVRELGVFCEILPGNAAVEKLLARQPKALILSGSPASVNEFDAPLADPRIYELGLPILGVCYGMQLTAHQLGGRVSSGALPFDETEVSGLGRGREYGPALVTVAKALGPFKRFAEQESFAVWMSHGDKVVDLPNGFEIIGCSDGAPVAAFAHEQKKIFGVQFHPEVHHTPRGKEIFSNFLFDTACLTKDWSSESFISQTVESIRQRVTHGNVVCGLSGGVDSTVAAVLVHRAIGDRLHCIFVDNGLLRENEVAEVMETMKGLGLNVHLASAGKLFLDELKGVVDPETKRKIIGRIFIDVFEEEAKRIGEVKYLVQGTLYPDVIESVSVVGRSQTIKSHHNVGGLKVNMVLELIEPLRELFKDEVRMIGRDCGVPEGLLMRQPFPGPGLAVRCLGEITEERLAVLRSADKIVREEVSRAGLDTVIWQSFAVLLPVRSVGVMGDSRTFEEVLAIRAVTSRDGMTADWYMFPEPVLRHMATRIINETRGVNRVVLDVSTKPPSTIEWE